MGDFEDAFGAGADAADIIEGFNADWLREQREEELGLKKLQSAYKGSLEVKASAVEQLTDLREKGHFPDKHSLLNSPRDAANNPFCKLYWSYAEIGSRYLIPEYLVRVADAIFVGLVKDSKKDHEIHCALDWPTRFMSAIRPGTYLQSVTPRFLADFVEHELTWWESSCDPAANIIKAQGRGVIVQKEVVAAAAKVARSAVPSHCDYSHEFKTAAISMFVGGEFENIVEAMECMARTYTFSNHTNDYFDGWHSCISSLLKLIEKAPGKDDPPIHLDQIANSIEGLQKDLANKTE